MTIDQLSKLPAEAFQNPDNLASDYDLLSSEDYAHSQYNKGLTIGQCSKVIHISIRNVWSAELKNGGRMSSYETIGYHAHTASLLRGFIDSGVTIVVWREQPEDDGSYTVVDTVIQGAR